jgi:crotonobetainyl-CoA:carnitine CoA-transferase CaiB-like acyl-CoA transferase
VTEIFHGIRIIDLTQGMAGSLATMILADYGADVIRLEPPGGDPNWSQPGYLLWNRGKKSVAPDWDSKSGLQQVQQLLQGADIFIESLGVGEVDARGLGYGAVSTLNPGLIMLSLSAFGPDGPYKDLKPYDGIVNAKSGRMRDQVGWQGDRPTFRAVNDISYHTAMFVVQALVAALRVRSLSGKGQRVDTSLLAGVTAPNNPWRRFEGQPLPADRYPREVPKDAVIRGELVLDRYESDPHSAIPSQLCAECADGRWIMHSHTQPELFKAWINTIGFEWIWGDPRFADAPRFTNDADRIALNLMIFARMKEKTSVEWREIYRRNPDCAGEIMQTTQEALRHEQFIANGHLVELDDPRVGRITQVGAFAKMSETPAKISRPAPLPGQHTEEILQGPMPVARSLRASGGNPARPLEGLMMLEMATWLAAPFAGALLADLGMRVIKVESLNGDPFRSMATNENMIRAFQGKENIALNLKTPEGQAIFHRLVAQADVVMHNFRPGAPARVGADYETLRKIKPDLVYVYAGSYGSQGPDAMRAAFNPTMGAFSGNSIFQSGKGNRPKGDQSPDPMAGSGVATGIMLGLAARLLTGKGQYIETSMMNSNVYANSDDAFYYEGKPDRRVPDKEQLGLEATYRLYEASDGWIFLAVRFDQEFASFCRLIGREDLPGHAHYATWEARYQHRDALGSVLAAVFRTRRADEWEQQLTAADLACVRADGPGHRRFLHEDPHTREIGFMVPTHSPDFREQAPEGKYWRHAPVSRFSETACEAGKPYRGLAAHTRDVLSELGYDDETIARMARDKVVGLSAIDG